MKNKERVIEFYDNASKDYEFWSPNFNMHFGLARFNIFNREKMLQKMNNSVLSKVGYVDHKLYGNYLDMGCGCGGTLHQASKLNNYSSLNGITLSKWQINKCNEIAKKEKLDNIKVVEGDFCKMDFENESQDGIWAIESICHSKDRLNALKEACRVLKKGKKMVITDGFVKVDPSKQGRIFQKLYKILCEGWSLPNLANINVFKSQLTKVGFNIKEQNDLSWKIAPSVVHSPFVILKYSFCNFIKNKPINKESKQNLKASFVAFFVGIQRNKFSYYQIVVEK